MFLMYVDESGDCGLPSDNSPTRYFCLSGVVVHELRWHSVIGELLQFRRWVKKKYGVHLHDELHTAEMINKPGKCASSIQKLKKYQRLAIIRNHADQLAKMADISIINVVVDKVSGKPTTKDEVFRWAWYTLFQRFENTIQNKNFPGSQTGHDRGLIFPDNTDGKKLRSFLNDMRANNLLKVKQRAGAHVYINEPIKVIIEDPAMKESHESYLIQAADCAAFLFKQKIDPSTYMKKQGGSAYFGRMSAVHCVHASRKDPAGIVRI